MEPGLSDKLRLMTPNDKLHGATRTMIARVVSRRDSFIRLLGRASFVRSVVQRRPHRFRVTGSPRCNKSRAAFSQCDFK